MPDENKPVINPQPPPVLPVIPPMAHDASISPPPPVVEKKDNQGINIPPVVTTSKKGDKKSRGKMIVTILGLFVLVGGIAAGVILVQQQQDIREKAEGMCDGWAEDGSVHCNTSECKQYTCNNGTWDGPQGVGICSAHRDCADDDGGGGDDCNGRCDKNGCTEDCSDVWPVSFYCRGLSHAACGELHESFLGFGVDPGGSIRHRESIEVRAKGGGRIQISPWCTTAQADSNTDPNMCIVVFIGDQGKWCIDDSCGRDSTECSSGITDTNGDGRVNQNDLDWDCGEEETASCDSCTVYDEDWEEINLTDITVGQAVYFTTLGSSVPDGLITKAGFKINTNENVDEWCVGSGLTVNEGFWCETTNKHDTYGYYVQYTIPSAGSYNIESSIYAGETLGWIPLTPPIR